MTLGSNTKDKNMHNTYTTSSQKNTTSPQTGWEENILDLPGYVQRVLKWFRYEWTRKHQHQPYLHVPPNYGQKIQYTPQTNRAMLLNKHQIKFMQDVTGTFLYYAWATEQAAPTTTTLKNTTQFLGCATTNDEAVLTYKASNMVLVVHNDASYLNKPQARSRAGGHFFMSHNTTFPLNNGAIHNTAQVIKAVMSLAAKAELGASYINTKFVAPIRHTLTEKGHPQLPMLIQTDNSTSWKIKKNLTPNCRKRTNDSKTGDKTDMSTG